MFIALYSPYLTQTAGGGERYLLTVAQILLQHDCQVVLLLPQKNFSPSNLISQWESNFGLQLSRLQIKSLPSSPIKKLFFTRQFDYLYFITDGSLFFSSAKHNLIHFQIPLINHPTNFLWKLKLKTWPIRVANSHFTKKIIEKHWRISIQYVHAAFADTNRLKPIKKINQILTVGRIFTYGHHKRHDFLIKAYKKLPQKIKQAWHFKIVGPVESGLDNQNYFVELKQLAKGQNISFESPQKFTDLAKIYGQSKIYWHAAGAGVDEVANPEKVEHLGLTTIEAMSAGCVPIVINKGGQKEIVEHQQNGFLWDTPQQLIQQTLDLIKSPAKTEQFAKTARQKVLDKFNFQQFKRQTLKIFS